ncbi:MAG: hypothetical protein LKF80_14805 [Brevundimonas sp.]|uniref:hypothetical protein n=1 Tax=Brevundimonas sp. TaxID=1871086 RepID=UPI0025BB7FC6|nr:hypothetical protein [Brevundimonas sp.]MCH4269665.1 hypothetical protein [Brevundimonas sp.]
MTIIDLGEWAESRFSTLCAAEGVTRNKASQDRTGWDYLVEFAPNELPGLPPDMQPAGASARIQVKAKGKGRPTASLRLSNALRFAKAPEPCFVVLFLAVDGAEPARIFARHFWTDLIGETLKRARRAEADGRTRLNVLGLPLTFMEEDEHTDDLLPWMRAQIEGVGGLYAEKKNVIAQTIGMEDGGIRGEFSIDISDWEAVVDHQIGLRAEAPVTHVTIRQSRFGIDAAKPLISFAPTSASMRPDPRPCRVRVRGAGSEVVWLDGTVVAPTFRNVPREHFKLRVQADFLDMVNRLDGDGDVTLNWSPDQQRSLRDLRNALDIARLLAEGPLDVQVRVDNQIWFGGECRLNEAERFRWAARFSKGLATLEAVVGADVPHGLTLSVRDLDDCWNEIANLSGLIADGDLSARLVFGEQVAPGPMPDSLWSYGYANVGGWSFLSIVSREICRFDVDGDTVRMVCGPARRVEGLVRPGDGRDHMQELLPLYRSYVRAAGKGAVEILEGDFRAMVHFLEAAEQKAIIRPGM